MIRENYRKVKLLKLLELLRQHTDEQHPLTTNQICAAMGEMGIPCDRRIVTQDVANLNELGYEIMSIMVGHEKAYYVADRNFSVPELKILIDAVQASSFITEKKTAELVEKLAALAGSHRAEVLKRNMVCFNTRKHSNESIYYNIGYLEDAIEQQKKVSCSSMRLTKSHVRATTQASLATYLAKAYNRLCSSFLKEQSSTFHHKAAANILNKR